MREAGLPSSSLRTFIWVAFFTLAWGHHLQALTITSGPVCFPSTNAPLAGELKIATDDYSRVSFRVDDGQKTWERNFYDYSTTHSLPLLGCRPSTTNLVTVVVHDRSGNTATAQPFLFITDPLPPDFPAITLLESVPEKMEPGYTLTRVANANSGQGHLTIVDSFGQVVWYSDIPIIAELRRLENGDLFYPSPNGFSELNMLGNVVRFWQVPTNLPVDLHEDLPTDHGTIIYLSSASRVVTNFPTSSTDPTAPTQTTNVSYQPVVEISASNAAVLNVWAPIDMIDPRRINYLTFTQQNPLGVDWEHGNAIIEDPRDDSLIVSMRHQDALIKFSRTTGKLKWILSSHVDWAPEYQQYLFTPVGAPFEWSYAQHGPMITPQGTLLLYDNGNCRADPFDPLLPDFDNYSRAVEFKLDEKNMRISQVWDYGRTNEDRLYTDRFGNTDWLPRSGNVLISFGYVQYENGVLSDPAAPHATMLRIKEVTHGPEPDVVFDLAFFDYSNTATNYLGSWGYRSHRIPDLYPVTTAARQVADLMPAVVSSGARRSQTLVASLGSALQSIEARNLPAAIHRLSTFQLLAKSANLPPGVAMQFICQAQGIIDAMRSGVSSYASERFTTIFPTFSSYHALADLVTEIAETNLRSRPQLITSLSGALTNLGKNNPAAALRGLRSFQALVRGAKADPASASRFQFEAQRLINAITFGGPLSGN